MENLRKVLEKNNFVIPNYKNLNIVDLAKTIYSRFGIKFESNSNIEKLSQLIPNNNHVLLILSDGTGSNLIDKLSSDSILRKNKKCDLITVFPSTTGCVLTSLVTATYPSTHGIWGWFNYNKDLDRDYYPVLFIDRKTKKSLNKFNIDSKDIFKIDSVLKKLNVKMNVLFPDYINDSVYSNFVANKEDRHPYTNFDDIVEFMRMNCQTNDKSYTYLYLPHIDDIEHNNGVDSKLVLNKLKEIESLVEKLSDNKNLTIIFTADHGQTNIAKDIVLDFKKYGKYFYAYPSIDYGTASYYIKKDCIEDFVREFEKDYKDSMYLFKTEDFVQENMFGIGKMSTYAKDNLGEYISICKKGSYLINDTNIEEYYGKIKGNHSGLTEDEMKIPLIVINTEE